MLNLLIEIFQLLNTVLKVFGTVANRLINRQIDRSEQESRQQQEQEQRRGPRTAGEKRWFVVIDGFLERCEQLEEYEKIVRHEAAVKELKEILKQRQRAHRKALAARQEEKTRVCDRCRRRANSDEEIARLGRKWSSALNRIKTHPWCTKYRNSIAYDVEVARRQNELRNVGIEVRRRGVRAA